MPEKLISQREQLLELGPSEKIDQLLSQSMFFERGGTTYVLRRTEASPVDWLRKIARNELLKDACEKVGLSRSAAEDITELVQSQEE